MTLRTLNYGNYDIFLIMGNAGFCPSTVASGMRAHGSQSGAPEFQLQGTEVKFPEVNP